MVKDQVSSKEFILNQYLIPEKYHFYVTRIVANNLLE